MATAREESGFGTGGKFRKQPFKRTTQATPYDRPSTALRNHHPPNINVNNDNGWLSKLVDPAQKLIISGAHRLFGSVFRKRLPPPPLQPEANHEAQEINHEIVSTVHPGVRGAINTRDDPHDTSDSGLTELEQILKQKTFTRSQIDRLTALLHSRTDDMPVGNDEQKRPEVILSTSLVSHDGKEASLNTPTKENGSGNQHISMPIVSSSALDEDVASPAEVARAFMHSQPSKVSPSTLGLRSQVFREESTLMSNRPISAASPSMSLVPRSSGQVRFAENGFVTPRSRGRTAIYNMARTPYSRPTSNATLKGAGLSFDSVGGPSSSSHRTFEKNSLTGSTRGSQKRRSSVLEGDIGSVGPIRRIRQKPNLLTSKTSTLGASGSLLSIRGTGVSDAVQQPSSSMQKPLLSGENKDSNIPSTSHALVPSKSSEMASRIFQQLEKLSSPREKSSMHLSQSMLRGPALKSLENVDSSMLLENVQDGNKLDGSAHTSLLDARDSTSQKRDKVEQNGPTKLISSFDKLVPAIQVADTAENNKDDVAGIKTTDSALTNSSAHSYPQKKRAFQMSAHEDYLELDDDDSSNGPVSTPLVEDREKLAAGTVSTPLVEDREKLGAGIDNKTAAAEATRLEEPPALSYVSPPSFLLSKTTNLGTDGRSLFAEKSSVFGFPTAASHSIIPQPAVVATASTSSNNAVNASPVFNFVGKDASSKESNDVSSAFNTSPINVDKIPQFTGVPAVRFGTSFDPKPGTSTSPASVAVGAIDSVVPESDKADKQSTKDRVIFRTPETAVATAASTSASAPGISSFGAPANNSSSLNNGSLASGPSITSSSMLPLASNTFTSQNLLNSSTTALSTVDSVPTSTATASVSAVFSTSVSPLSATFGVESTEPKTKDASFGNSTATPIGGTSAFTSTQSSIFSSTSPAIAGTGSSIFGGTSSAVTSTVSSVSVGVSAPVTSTGGGLFGSMSATTGTASSIFGISAGASSAASSQSLFSNSFTAGSAQASGTGNGVVTSSQIMPVQFGSSATSSAFELAGTPAFSSSSSPFGTSVSAAKPFSSSPSFGLSSATSLSEANSISSGSGTTSSVFGSSWQAQKSPFGSTFSSSTPARFSFNASTSSAATNSVPVFGASTGGAPSSSIFPFSSTAAATSSQPTFGNASSVNPFGSTPTNNNDQVTMEDSMAEDTVQSSTPTAAAFGQQSITSAPGFVFGSTASSYPFHFSSQQNQNPSLFQSSNSLDFNAGAAGGSSFSLGSGGGDKSHRRIVKVSKGKGRRK